MSSIEVFATTLGRLVEELTGPTHGELTRARHAVITQAELGSELRTELAFARQQISSWMRPLLTGLGSRDPHTHVDYLLALLDGLLLTRMAEPPPQPRPSVAIAALLHGLLDPDAEAIGA
jgi:hypothetical protein